ERKAACDEGFAPVEGMIKTLKEKGHADILIIAGGTPTFPIHLERKKVICSPGTFVYWDFGYGEVLAEQPFTPAAVVVTRIISLPGKGLITVDLGHKSRSEEHTSELQSRENLVCRLLLEKKNKKYKHTRIQ